MGLEESTNSTSAVRSEDLESKKDYLSYQKTPREPFARAINILTTRNWDYIDLAIFLPFGYVAYSLVIKRLIHKNNKTTRPTSIEQ